VAQAATGGRWKYSDIASIAGGVIYGRKLAIVEVRYDAPSMEWISDREYSVVGTPAGSIRRNILTDEADANGTHIARHDPPRVLAECAAKRAIVRVAEEIEDDWITGDHIFRALAQPYRDREGWQREWEVPE